MIETAKSTRRFWPVAAALAALWLLIAGWQATEHAAGRKSARAALINRGRDITTTLGLVVRSQRRFGGIVSKERLESALNELVTPGELNSVALLNAAGDTVASAGSPIDLHRRDGKASEIIWDEHALVMLNLVDLGTSLSPTSNTSTNPTIVVTREFFAGFESNRFGGFSRGDGRRDSTNRTNTAENFRPPSGPWNSTNATPRPPPRPPWMKEDEYRALTQRQGLHSMVIAMSTGSLREALDRDLWQRGVICLLAAVSVVGSGFAWRNLVKSSELQLRLVRASELNLHLKEMNLAAAGLAHETRNPLNLIRGMAQLISKDAGISPDIRKRSREIIDEADRVTAQLNEFINYSRPREVRRAPIPLDRVISEVVRALGHDLEEKSIRLTAPESGLCIEADEQLLRQLLFNLLINSIQAVEANGEIHVVAARAGNDEAALEIRDNGPGVAPEQRREIFKPYFTTHQKGTGLGLAIVQQIVSAHGWEIVCLGNEPKGALFRISHLRLCRTNTN
jgi:signal transduction histidine kinase